MLGFVKRRAFLTLIGFLLLAAFIWFAGPYFAFAEYRPLDAPASRLILFGTIVLFWAAGRLMKRLRAYRASDRLVAAVVRQASPDAQPSAEALQLRERFEQAVATLQQSRRGGHSLYDLPWYIIIGAPGSGKTTALLNSGLKFPLEQRVGKGALRGVGGTRNCDWWFTDEAVFLDTAGRYTTQDSDAASDAAGWSEFLALLQKYRKRRPLNGVILTISAQDLLVHGEREREIQIEAARRRLEEVNRELRIQLPVYVMVTKCDLVAGFSEYFDDLTQEGRAQVWGVTFPYEQTVAGEAPQAFPTEFDQLMARLNARVFARIDGDRDVRRRARIFGFPQQMAALRDALSQFVGEVFASTQLDRRILLRGVYLTSGTQEGTPIDRLLGAIGRRYGVAPEAVVPQTGRGKAYFVERMLKEVLIGESGLAGLNRRLEVQKAALQLAAYAAMAVIAALGLIALSVSYGRNQAYLGETDEVLNQLEPLPPAGTAASPEALLPRLDSLQAVVDSADRYRTDRPVSMRWGLYQGTSVGNAARGAYVRELDATLLPQVAARIGERLVEYGREPEKLYEYLKAYRMLGEPRFLDKQHLQFVAGLEWSGAASDTSRRLSQHFESLLEYGGTLRPVAIEAALVTQACNTIRQASIPRIIYGRLRRQFQEDPARVVRLDLLAGIGAERVLRRRSGVALSEPLPGFFSRPVFEEVTGRHVPSVVKAFAADDWVCSDGAAAGRNASTLGAEVIDLYEGDYIVAWDAILEDLELVPFVSTSQAADALATLAGPASPLRALLGAVSEQTFLVQPHTEPPPASGAAATVRKGITDRLGGKAVVEGLGGLFGQATAAPGARPPGVRVTAYFQPLHRSVSGEPGSAPIDNVLAHLRRVEQHLSAAEPGRRVDSLTDPELRQILRALQQEAQALPPVIRSLVEQIGRRAEGTVVSGAAGELERRYADDVQRECTDLLTGRYPFTPGSPNDLPLRDFVRLFGVGQVFDTFFRENLEPLVDRSRRPWTWRSGAVQGPRGLLTQLERAQDIRELFFQRGSGQLELRFHLTVADIDPSAKAFVLNIGAQGLEYRRPAAPRMVVWPEEPPSASAVWTVRTGAQPRLSYSGPWAWFRLMGAAQEERESDGRTLLVFREAGHTARVMLEPSSVHNPFVNREWQRFRCQL